MEQFLQNILTASFHGSIVILAVLALRLLLRKAPKKYLCMLWLLVGIRLLLPFRLESTLSLQPEVQELPGIRQEVTVQRPIPGMEMGELPVSPSPQTFTQAAQSPDFGPTEPAEPVQKPETPAINWAAGIPWVYLLVVAAFGVYCIQGYLRLRHKVRFAVKIPGGWECEGIETAFILGFIKPKIYIPMGMNRQNRRYILAHERTHLEKGDHWVKLIAFLVLAMHWFNPLVWVAYFFLCRDIEMACDERVVRFMELEERKQYSYALLTCSSNRAHYSACPMAFGEVNVKNRIKSVLNYRKPSFWVSLVSVVAIIAVAVTLVTSPRAEVAEEIPSEQVSAENQESGDPPKETLRPGEKGFCSGMTEAEIAYTCEKAFEALRSGNHYITLDSTTVNTNENYDDYSQMTHYWRHGDSYLAQNLEENVMVGGFLEHEGKHGYSWGTPFMLWGDESWGSDKWMEVYTPAGKMIGFPEGTGVIAGDRVSYYAQWIQEEIFGDRAYEGTFTYVFHPDGTIREIQAQFSFRSEDGTITETTVLKVQSATEEEIRSRIQSVADNAMDSEEHTAYLKDLETITEVPSNKTTYDKDFMLGSGSSQWKFFEEQGHVRIGAADCSSTGMTLQYSEADELHSAFTAEKGFWLEQLVDGKWTVIGEYDDVAREIRVSWDSSDSCQLTWDKPLSGGFYRLGRYHTMTLNGQQETAVCYAKFRLYEGEEKELMDQARTAFDALLARESYYVSYVDYKNVENLADYLLREEVWKSGKDYLMLSCHPYKDGSAYWSKSGAMWRDGIRYSLQYAGDTVSSPITSWETNTYMDEFNFTMWSYSFEWYDGEVEQVVQKHDEIIIQLNYGFHPYEGDKEYERIQVVLQLDPEGNITHMARRYLPALNCPEKEMVISQELWVWYLDPQETAEVIRGQDLTAVPEFSWAEDKARYPVGSDNVRSRNFVNNSAVTMAGTNAVIQRALLDCTLPAAMGLEPGTNVSKACFDPVERIWKIEFTASWDSRIYQAVYLTEQGITVLTVTLEKEPTI